MNYVMIRERKRLEELGFLVFSFLSLHLYAFSFLTSCSLITLYLKDLYVFLVLPLKFPVFLPRPEDLNIL